MNINDIVVFKVDWKERHLFSHSEYKIVKLTSYGNKVNLEETKSKMIYHDVPISKVIKLSEVNTESLSIVKEYVSLDQYKMLNNIK